MRSPCTALFTCLLFLPSCGRERLPGGEVRVEAVRIASSKAKTPADIAPYDEALAWHEYDVKALLAGDLDAKRIRVAHWTVLRGEQLMVSTIAGEGVELRLRPFETAAALKDVASSDDLDIATDGGPLFIDIGQARAQNLTPQALRYDYGGSFSDQMKLFWRLRSQLRLVAMGNSHATKDICTGMFFPGENDVSPVALNLAPAGANNRLQCLVIRDYALRLPKLEWVVWVMSPRSFNSRRSDDLKLDDFLASPGFMHDQKHRDDLWPAPAQAKPTTISDLATLQMRWRDAWGWEGRTKINLPASLEEARPALLKELSGSNASFDEDAWRLFTETTAMLVQRKIRVLLVEPPFHPITRETPAVDPESTSQKVMGELVAHLEEFDSREPFVWFKDFHQGGNHEFPHDEFYDADHLNREGARHLTSMIIEWMARCR
jgi:hypothetical protein